MQFLNCRHAADKDEIKSLEPLDSNATEYIVRVQFGYGDRLWGEWLIADTKDLAQWLFKEND